MLTPRLLPPILVLAVALTTPPTTAHGQGAGNSGSHDAIQVVIAEGVGASPREALNDAFRNAVRQVVGAVVDSETLVKNDEVIDDKVLTYSNGIIKEYVEVPGSKKTQGILHRVKIRANVERRAVVAKLRAANITVKEIDGKGLVAEAVTQFEAGQNAAQLLRKQLEGFPQSCITASVTGKPSISAKDGNSATITFTVAVETDLKSYLAFAKRLKSALEAMAQSRGEFTATFQLRHSRADPTFQCFVATGNLGVGLLLRDWMPRLFNVRPDFAPELKPNMTAVALGIARSSAGGDRIGYHYFACDNSIQSELTTAASRHGVVNVVLLDGKGETVATDSFKLFETISRISNGGYFHGTLIAACGRVNGIVQCMDLLSDLADSNKDLTDRSKDGAHLFLISPTFVKTGNFQFGHKTKLTFERKIHLSLEEIEQVKEIKCKVEFE